jgi:hypothetical protein
MTNHVHKTPDCFEVGFCPYLFIHSRSAPVSAEFGDAANQKCLTITWLAGYP